MPEERIALELDWPKISRELGRALEFEPGIVKVGLWNTLQIGMRRGAGGEGVPVILTLASSRNEMLNVVALMVAKMGKPFVLLAPTKGNFSAAGKEMIEGTGGAFFSLEETVRVEAGDGAFNEGAGAGVCRPAPGEGTRPTGREIPIRNRDFAALRSRLIARVAPRELFGEVFPQVAEVSDEELARRTFVAVQEHDLEKSKRSRMKTPTLYAVFELYCIQEKTIPEVARKCGCSIGTVANRLRLLEAKTGVSAEGLRRVAPHFVRYKDDMGQAVRNLRRRANR
jgi:hypothetical protein